MKIFKTRSFSWWEMGLLKLSLISLGIILGLQFWLYLEDLMILWIAAFIAPAVYFIVRFFREDK